MKKILMNFALRCVGLLPCAVVGSPPPPSTLTQVEMENTLLKPMSCPSCANVLGASGTISGTIPSSVQYCINNDVTISGTVTFIDISVQIDTDKKIVIPSGSTLQIYRSHLYGCNDMWRGIEVKDGGSLIIAENSMIEDAILAVRADFPSGTTTTSTLIDISYTLFNKNKTGISISNYANSSGYYPFYIRDCIFSCRKIPSVFFGFDIQLLKQTITPAHPLGAPYFDNAVYPAEVLKAPYTGRQSYIGIDIAFIGKTQTPLSTPVYSEWEIGDPFTTEAFNLFDLQETGIRCYNSNVSSVNAVFQNAAWNVNGGQKSGITCRSFESDDYWRLRVEPDPDLITSHAFYDCGNAIDMGDYFAANIIGTLMQSTQDAAFAPNLQGENGVWATTNRFEKYHIIDNEMYNLSNGISFLATFGAPIISIGGLFYTQYGIQVKISENRIQAAPTGISVNNAYVQNAVVLNNTSPLVFPSYFSNTTSLTVTNNVIQEVYRGVQMQNWRQHPCQITNNYITLTSDLIDPLLRQFGIEFNNNIGNISGYDKQIIGNSITGFGLNKQNVWSIYCDMNAPFEVLCNQTDNTFRGIQFDRDVPGTTQRFLDNVMTKHEFGYILGNNGRIGPQMAPPDVSDNQWINNVFMTLADASDATLSPLNVRPLPGYDPDGFGTSVGGGIAYSTTNGNITYGNPNTPARTCPAPPTAQMLAMSMSNIGNMEQVALGNTPYFGDTLAARSMSEIALFATLQADTTLLDSSLILRQFYEINDTSNIGRIHAIAHALLTGNYAQAHALHTGFTTTLSVENAYKDLMGWMIKAQSLPLSVQDSIGLATLANACPSTEGMSVYTARAYHNAYFHSNHTFESNCEPPMQNNNRQLDTPQAVAFTLYPNPTEGELYVQSTAKISGTYQLQIWDAIGRCLTTQTLSDISHTQAIATPFPSGLYFLHLQHTTTHETHILPFSIR